MTPDTLVRTGRLVGLSRAGDTTQAELVVASDCESCRSRCLVGSRSAQRVVIDVPHEWEPSAGDRAHMGVSRSALNLVCALVFGVPLASWLIGGVLGNHFWGEAGAVWLASACLVAALLGVVANRGSLRRWVKLELIALRPVGVD